jgi:hypothetical protein
VVDPVGQGVFEARFLDGAVGADLAGLLDADAVGGEEVVGGAAAAPGLEHPLMLLVVGRRRGRKVEIHSVHGLNDAGGGPVPEIFERDDERGIMRTT